MPTQPERSIFTPTSKPTLKWGAVAPGAVPRQPTATRRFLALLSAILPSPCPPAPVPESTDEDEPLILFRSRARRPTSEPPDERELVAWIGGEPPVPGVAPGGTQKLRGPKDTLLMQPHAAHARTPPPYPRVLWVITLVAAVALVFVIVSCAALASLGLTL